MPTLRSHIPGPVRHPLRRAIRYTGWWFSGAGYSSRALLEALKDRHAGERCVIVGNGPSLRQMDLTVLGGVPTIGFNRIYLAKEELGFSPDYYVCVNDLILGQFADEIAAQSGIKLLSWRNRNLFKPDNDIAYLRTSAPELPFSQDLRNELWEGATVTYVGMQLAYHLGFAEACLIGVDHDYTYEGRPHEEQVMKEEDVNHFNPGYFGPGIKWNLPDLDTSERAYRKARKAFEADGRRIVDATVGGKLNAFEKVEFASYL